MMPRGITGLERVKELPVPTKRATFILIKVKSCNVLLHMLLASLGIFQKSVLRYNFLILDT
jgi:hypothetical protein